MRPVTALSIAVVVVLYAVVLVGARSASAAQGGPDAHGNIFIDSDELGGPVFAWEDLEGLGTPLDLGDEDDAQVPIGFDFEFYGVTYDLVTVQSNGALSFDDDHLGYSNVCLPQAGPPDSIVAVYWDDLNPDSEGQVYYATLGVAPDRVFVAQWKDVARFGSYATFDFEVLLYEASGETILQYDDVVSGYPAFDQGASATIGIQGGTSGHLQYSCVAASLDDGLAIRFEPCEPADDDGDGYSTCAGDCDDTNPDTWPGAPELCDGLDNDCDGVANDLVDQDGDGLSSCDGDCDDADPNAYPGAAEVCNGADDDCDGLVDEDAQDSDGDGVTDCDGDCDDADPDVHPGAPEDCDGVDSDCGDDLYLESDDDGDGLAECEGDCDDTNVATFPGAEEVCDGVDNDCDPATDENVDEDGDGHPACEGDCDDGDADIHPGAADPCDGVDSDCGGDLDQELDDDGDGVAECEGDCDDADPGSYPGADEVPYDGIDQDCDGADLDDADGDGWPAGPGMADCNDAEPSVNPDEQEICDDGLDNDCDGAFDLWDSDCFGYSTDEEAGPGAGGSSGCSCRQDGDPASRSGALLLVIAGWHLRRRRRAG